MTAEIASVRLVSRNARVVELLGPTPLGSRRPTDVELKFQTYPQDPRKVGFCFSGEERRAKFRVDEGSTGDAFLDFLESARTGVRLARPYGIRGYVVEESARAVSQRGGTPRKGEIFHSGVPGQILAVNGKPVRR